MRFLLLLSLSRFAVAQSPQLVSVPLDSPLTVTTSNTRLQWQEYRGRKAVKLAPLPGHEAAQNEEMQAVLPGTPFHNGVIEVDVAGARRQGYSTAGDLTGFKGMIGISFRVRADSAERFYVRPQNARLDDQLFRNRATQYESMPDHPWNQLRASSPGVYESYVDLDPGVWTHLRIEVEGTKARLYVNGSPQPCLIVNDLKLGDSRGQVALWARVSTDAYFTNLRVGATP
ncbi:MAG TPA: hypothetical protein VH163_08790 [Gemmatimonadales bacterium]|jgi:hypothetical protein|nr:hypothetical protein [Gemmatimonadales bacterium]